MHKEAFLRGVFDRLVKVGFFPLVRGLSGSQAGGGGSTNQYTWGGYSAQGIARMSPGQLAQLNIPPSVFFNMGLMPDGSEGSPEDRTAAWKNNPGNPYARGMGIGSGRTNMGGGGGGETGTGGNRGREDRTSNYRAIGTAPPDHVIQAGQRGPGTIPMGPNRPGGTAPSISDTRYTQPGLKELGRLTNSRLG